jgi:hypothetical protein
MEKYENPQIIDGVRKNKSFNKINTIRSTNARWRAHASIITQY